MATSITRNTHTLSLLDGEIVEESDLGSMRRITADDLSILKNMWIKRVLLNPGAMRTPHWHANADELTYCVSGTALVSIRDDGSKFSSFVVTAGQMFHAASGSLHHVENIGSDEWHFLIFFDQPTPADIGYRASASAYRREVLAAAFDTHLEDLPTFPFTPADPLIVGRVNPVD